VAENDSEIAVEAPEELTHHGYGARAEYAFEVAVLDERDLGRLRAFHVIAIGDGLGQVEWPLVVRRVVA